MTEDDLPQRREIVQTPESSAPISGDGRIKRTAGAVPLMRVRSKRTRETRNPDHKLSKAERQMYGCDG